MAKYPDKKIIIIMGTLSSGKGTQADKIAEAFGLHHFDTGPFLKKILSSDDPSIAKEKSEYESGKWVSPEFVVKKVLEHAPIFLIQSKGIIFSGSPRTIYEVERELPVFEELVGPENVVVFNLDISEAESLKRSLGRLICDKNKHPIPDLPEFQEIRKAGVCPHDGSKLIKKDLDKPETLKSRSSEHNQRTLPVIDFFRKCGYKVIEINGEQPIDKVFADMMCWLPQYCK